jgi:hypothetical protein
MRHEPPPREAHCVTTMLAQDQLATMQVLRVAMSALALEAALDAAVIAGVGPLQALIRASREVVAHLGYDDDQDRS